MAVADADDLVLAVEVCDLVYISRLFGFLKDFHDLFISSVIRVLMGLYKVLSHIADCDTPVILDLAAAFASDPLLPSAGAYIDAELVILLQPVRQLLV